MTDNWLGEIGSLASAAAKGAATGSIVPGLGTGVGAAIGIATELVPDLAKWVGVDTKVADKVIKTVEQVTNSADSEKQVATVAANPDILTELKVKLAAIAADQEKEDLKSTLADVANARAQNLALVNAHSPLEYGAAIVSVVIVIGFFATEAMLIFSNTSDIDDQTFAVLNQIVGVLLAAFVAVFQYWVGSSAGSAFKTKYITNMNSGGDNK